MCQLGRVPFLPGRRNVVEGRRNQFAPGEVWNKSQLQPTDVEDLGPDVWQPKVITVLGTPIGSEVASLPMRMGGLGLRCASRGAEAIVEHVEHAMHTKRTMKGAWLSSITPAVEWIGKGSGAFDQSCGMANDLQLASQVTRRVATRLAILGFFCI